MIVRRCAAITLAWSAGLAGVAHAATAPDPPMRLPGSASAATSAREPATWIVAGKPGAGTERIARRHGARPLLLDGAYTVPRSRARALARSLRGAGLLRYAEPDVPRRRAAAPDAAPDGWARGAVLQGVVGLPIAVPVGIADSVLDPTHPDLAGHTSQLNPGGPVTNPHGTQVASVAAGAANGSGVTGLLPGAPIVSYGIPDEFGCSESVDAIVSLVGADVRAINTSYGSASPCYAEYAAIIRAYGAGALIIAAAGNEFREGNPLSYPAAFPHVLSVGALNPDLSSAGFSSASLAVDVAAPGVQVPAAVPFGLDTDDGAQDGVAAVDGTSFAAPLATAAVAAVLANRPGLSIGQVGDLLRYSARDVWRDGYDTDTGFGLIDLRAALAAPAPANDPLEPNDSIAEVDGRIFNGADAPVWRGSGRTSLRARVDTVKDPVDVYRIRVPAKAAFTITLRPRSRDHDPDLFVFSSRAKSVTERRTRIDESVRGAGRTDSVRLVNRSGDARALYVVVTVPDEAQYANADYSLEFRRRPRR